MSKKNFSDELVLVAVNLKNESLKVKFKEVIWVVEEKRVQLVRMSAKKRETERGRKRMSL